MGITCKPVGKGKRAFYIAEKWEQKEKEKMRINRKKRHTAEEDEVDKESCEIN